MSEMKYLQVVAGIIRRTTDNVTQYFATQRGYGDYKGMWEFPGGKVEPGETNQQALARELSEELAIQVSVGDFVCTVEQDYPGRHVTMHCYFCDIVKGTPTLLEHESAQWLTLENIRSVNWLPADISVVERLLSFNT